MDIQRISCNWWMFFCERGSTSILRSSFLCDRVIFLVYIVSARGLKIDSEKIRPLWSDLQHKPSPTSEVSLDWHPSIAYLYGALSLLWAQSRSPQKLKDQVDIGHGRAFEKIITVMTRSLVLALLNFEKVFVVELDASQVGVGVLSQEGCLVALARILMMQRDDILSTT